MPGGTGYEPVSRKQQKKPLQMQGQKRMTGIEPASKAWEAFILPMNYIRMDLFITKPLYSELLLM